VRVAPHLAGLEWAKGTVPTPRGEVSVDWKHVPAGLELEVTSPVHMPVVLDLGGMRAGESVTIDGTAGTRGADGTYALAPGRHIITFEASDI